VIREESCQQIEAGGLPRTRWILDDGLSDDGETLLDLPSRGLYQLPDEWQQVLNKSEKVLD